LEKNGKQPYLYMNRLTKTSLTLAVVALSAATAHAQYILGSFQGASDPTDAGWIDPGNSDPITADPNATFPTGAVPGYAQSLQMGGAGGFGNPSLELQFSPAQVAAFNANSYITFTWSVAPGAATAGYSQIYNLVLNAPGYGYNNFMNGGSAAATWGAYSQATGTTSFNQNGEPNYYFYSGDAALDTESVTINYASVLAAIQGGGESYLQMTFTGNDGGGAPTTMLFNNVELSTGPFGSSVPEPSTIALGVTGISALLFRRRK
jgi:hypothetical protein